MKILECSGLGDRRFSAMFAEVSVFNKIDSIENHYQSSKRFNKVYKDPKGKNPAYGEINNIKVHKDMLKMFYTLMWIKYFDHNNDLIKYAKTFDDFTDRFRSKNCVVCQADVIKNLVINGRKKVYDECMPLILILRTGNTKNNTIIENFMNRKK